MRRAGPYAAAFLAVALVVAPAARGFDRDSFPLSSYPMFAGDTERTTSVDVAVGLRADGSRVRLSPEVVGGNDEVVLASGALRDAIRAGGATLDAFCRRVAARAADEGLVEIRIATERHDAVTYWDGDGEPRDEIVHTECAR